MRCARSPATIECTAAPRSSSPTASRRCASPTASSSWNTDESSTTAPTTSSWPTARRSATCSSGRRRWRSPARWRWPRPWRKPPRTTPTRWWSTRRPGRTNGSASATWWRRWASPRPPERTPGAAEEGVARRGTWAARCPPRRSCSPSWPNSRRPTTIPRSTSRSRCTAHRAVSHCAGSADRSAAASRSGSSSS